MANPTRAERLATLRQLLLEARYTSQGELSDALAEHGIDFKDLHSSESSLEDIFVSLVHTEPAA